MFNVTQFVFNAFVITNAGFGDWFQRSNLPEILHSYCPEFAPIYKTSDFLSHNQESFADIFSATVDARLVERLLTLDDTQLYTFPLSTNKPWRPQFEAFDCTSAKQSTAIVFRRAPLPPEVRHEFNDRLSLQISPRYALPLEPICAIRVCIHYRAGDVFHGLQGRIDPRSMPIPAVRDYVTSMRHTLDTVGVVGMFYVLTEMNITDAIQFGELIGGGVNMLAASKDGKTHMAMAAKCDVLVLGGGSFSWVLALINKEALKVVYNPNNKYNRLEHVFPRNKNYTSALHARALAKKSRPECAATRHN